MQKRRRGYGTWLILLLPSVACNVVAAEPSVVADLLAPSATVERLTGFGKGTWLEGPVWIPEGFVVYSNIPANRLQRWPAGALGEVFREAAGSPNGNALWEGRLLTCEQEPHRLATTLTDGTRQTLCERFGGGAFHSPNDLVVDPAGRVWFTDPTYGRGKRPAELPQRGVYRYDPETGAVALLVTDFEQPNGIGLAPDGRTLYVSDTGKARHIRAFPLDADGVIGAGRVFAVVSPGVPDGLKVDIEGRVWSSAGDGVQVFNPDGSRLGTIPVPETTANLCFGGAAGTTLYMTATTSLYAVELAWAPLRNPRPGPRYP